MSSETQNGPSRESIKLGSVSIARGCLAAVTGLLAILFSVAGLSILGLGVANVLEALCIIAFGLVFFGRATFYLGAKAFPASIVFHPTELVMMRPLQGRAIIPYADLDKVWDGTTTTTVRVDGSTVHENIPTLFFRFRNGDVLTLYAPDEMARKAVLGQMDALLISQSSERFPTAETTQTTTDA